MKKHCFIIVGSGWRSLFFVRIAKTLPEVFELGAMLCRTEEKAERMARENDIYTTTSIDECRGMNPDFVVVAVNKASIAEVSKEWMGYGCTVLCETPAAQDIDTLNELWQLHREGGRLMVAEQYIYNPTYRAQLKVIEQGLIGEPSFLHISLAHEYHGASLMRAYLNLGVAEPFAVSAKTYEFPTVETMSRYEKFTDGRVADKKRTIGLFEFANGKVAVYEFDSEQYRSPIRSNYVKLQGVRGEMKDNTFYWLDENNEPQNARLEELECPFEENGLTKDETAITALMLRAAEYERAEAEQNLRNALQDAYMAILMKQAMETGEKVASASQAWQED